MIEAGRMVFSDSMDAFDNYLSPSSLLVTLENMPAESALLAIKGVNRVEMLTGKQVRVYFEPGQVINEKIVEASIQNNWRLMEISADKILLDDTFKQLSIQSAN
jgi:ABC-2 type transport system ATP-binding protein